MQQLGKYTLGTELGQGGAGIVYASHHPQLERPVAIKVLLPGADHEFQQRFIHEARVVASLSHPGIIKILDVDTDGQRPFIVMELISGGSLADRIAAGPLALDTALQVMLALCDALGYAHRQGIIHRDLKPANVLLRSDGSPVLADFGLALLPASPNPRLTSAGIVIGTPAYMAPEQLASRPLDQRSDIYALGVMLFEMLTGRLPFDGDTGAMIVGHLQQPPPSLRLFAPSSPPALDALLQRMLAKDPADRPPDISGLIAELHAIRDGAAMTGATVRLPAQPVATPIRAVPRRVQLISGLLMAGIVAGIVIMGIRLAGNQVAVESSEPQIAAPPVSPAPPRTLDPTAVPPVELVQLEAAPFVGAQQSIGDEPFSLASLSWTQATRRLWFFGEVRNDGHQAREAVRIFVVLYDAAGRLVGEGSGYTDAEYLAPGEIAPFSVLFDEGIGAFETFQIDVRSRSADFALRTTVRDLTVERLTFRRTYGSIMAGDGVLYNGSGLVVSYPQVYVVFYDAERRVVAVTSGYAQTDDNGRMAIDARSEFDFSWATFSGEPDAYRVYVEAHQFD